MSMISFRKHGSVSLTDNDENEEGETFALHQFHVEDHPGESSRRSACLKKKDFKVNFLFVSNTIVVIVIGLAIVLTRHMDVKVPEPVLASEAGNDTIRFSEERARRDLEHLTSVGVRVSGSEAADVTTVQNILDALSTIKESGNSKFFDLEYTIQRPTGSFYIDKNGGFTSVYAGISNIIAKLEPVDGTNDSVLVNCHFDTKPGTPGASDNMISCVTMLEVIRTLYHYRSGNETERILKNSIVFLFNGAEEMYLQGAHGFILGDGGHPWSHNVRCFVNLEAAGSGGKEILFQSGPGNGWILKSYVNSVPHPYANVFAEELFQAGLIPSDTDFRIFRDYKHIPGLDMAFVKNGWVYHTKWDRVIDIPPGSVQNMGDNVLALVRDLGNLDIQDSIDNSGSQMVFYDVLGLFVVSYIKTVGIAVNLLTAVIFIALVLLEVNLRKSRKKLMTILWLLISANLAWGTGIATGALVGCFFNGIEHYKPFFSYPFMAIILFGLPAVFAQALTFSFALDGSQRKSWLAGKFTMAVGLLIFSFVIRSSYALCIILLFATLAWIPRRFIFSRYENSCSRYFQFVSDVIIGEVVPLIITLPLIQTDFLIPITGRTGPGINANIAIGVLMASSVAILVFGGLSTYLVPLKKIHLIIALLFSFFVINPVVVVGFIGKIPYQTKTPMRLRIANTDRTWYNSDWTINRTDAGYWLQPVDPDLSFYVPEFAKTAPELSEIVELAANLNTCPDLYCSQPLSHPAGKSTRKTPWLTKKTGLPSFIKDGVQLQDIRIQKKGRSRNVTLKFTGPAQNTIVLSPGTAFELVNWSLESPPKMIDYLTFRDRPVYFIYLGKGYYTPSFSLSLELRATSDKASTNNTNDQILLDVMYTGHFMHRNLTQEHEIQFQDFLDQFPSWTNLMTWSSVLKQYSITI